MFYAFGGSKTLVKHTFFIMILTWDTQKHWQAPKNKKNKPLDAPNIDRHQKNQKKQKFQQLLRSGPIVPGNFSFFVFFGACAGLVHLVVWFFCFFGTCAGLVTLTSQNIDRHQKNQTTRCTKHRQAPKKQKKQKFQQLLRSGPIVPGNFSFFGFFGACAGLVHLVVWFFCFFGACAGLVTLTSQNIDRHQKNQKNQTTRCTKHRQAPKKPKKTKIPATTQKWTHRSWKF